MLLYAIRTLVEAHNYEMMKGTKLNNPKDYELKAAALKICQRKYKLIYVKS